jgi:hypothetical protein
MSCCWLTHRDQFFRISVSAHVCISDSPVYKFLSTQLFLLNNLNSNRIRVCKSTLYYYSYYYYYYYYFLWLCSPAWAMASSFYEVSWSHKTKHHSRQYSSGRVISSSQRAVPDNTQHKHPCPRWDFFFLGTIVDRFWPFWPFSCTSD